MKFEGKYKYIVISFCIATWNVSDTGDDRLCSPCKTINGVFAQGPSPGDVISVVQGVYSILQT
jgi:hypothetical protein